MKKLTLTILFFCSINGMKRSPRKKNLFILDIEYSPKKDLHQFKSRPNESLDEGLKRFDKEHPDHK